MATAKQGGGAAVKSNPAIRKLEKPKRNLQHDQSSTAVVEKYMKSMKAKQTASNKAILKSDEALAAVNAKRKNAHLVGSGSSRTAKPQQQNQQSASARPTTNGDSSKHAAIYNYK